MLIVKDGAAKVRSDSTQALEICGSINLRGGRDCMRPEPDFARFSCTLCEQHALGLTPGGHDTGTQEGGEARHSILQIPHPRHGEKTVFFLVGHQGLTTIRARACECAAGCQARAAVHGAPSLPLPWR